MQKGGATLRYTLFPYLQAKDDIEKHGGKEHQQTILAFRENPYNARHSHSVYILAYRPQKFIASE